MAATDHTELLLIALRSAMLADPQIAAITTRVFDWPPAGEPLPMLTLNAIGWSTWDTADSDGQEIKVDVHVWDADGSDAPDSTRARLLMKHLRRVFHRAPLDLDGLVLLEVVGGSGPRLDPDGVTLHGIVTLRALAGLG